MGGVITTELGQVLNTRDSQGLPHNDIMLPSLQLIPGAIPAMLASAAEQGHLTLADRYGLLAATLDDSLDDVDRRAVDRLLRAVIRGRISIVEDLCLG